MGAAPVCAAGRLQRWLHARRGRGGLHDPQHPRPDTRARGRRLADGQEPPPAGGGARPRAALPHAGDDSRVRARAAAGQRRAGHDAEPARRRAHRAGGAGRARADRPRAGDLVGPARARARQPAGCPPVVRGDRRARAVAAALWRALAVLVHARLPGRGAALARRRAGVGASALARAGQGVERRSQPGPRAGRLRPGQAPARAEPGHLAGRG